MRTASDRGAASWPGPVYVDASALAKLYLPEAGSGELNRALGGRRDLLLSDLAITETISALARRRRAGEVGVDDVLRLQGSILETMARGSFQRVELFPSTHRRAEELLTTSSTNLRAADALHLALAGSVSAATMLSFDDRLRAAASTIGLAVVP